MNKIKAGDTVIIEVPKVIIAGSHYGEILIPMELLTDIKKKSVNIVISTGDDRIRIERIGRLGSNWAIPLQWCSLYNVKEHKMKSIKEIKL